MKKVRLISLPITAALGAACFPGYSSRVESGQATTAFVAGPEKISAVKTEAGLSGAVLNVQVSEEFTCKGDMVTTTPQTKVFEREGVSPPVGIAIGALSAGAFAAAFLSGVCDPDDPRLFDYNPDPLEGGVSVGLATCDLGGGALTVLGFSSALAYGATSIKNLVSKPQPEELPSKEDKKPTEQVCGDRQPITKIPLLVYMPSDKGLAYAWPDAQGKVSVDLSSLIDPSQASGKATVAFATQTDKVLYTAEAEEVGKLRPSGWAPVNTGQPISGAALLSTSWYELSDVNEDVRHLTLHLKLKNPGTAGVSVRGRLVSDHPGLNARNYIWEEIAAGAELEKTIEFDLPKALPDPGRLDVYLIEKTGQVAAKASASNGPPPPPPPPPAPVVTPTAPPVTPPTTPPKKDPKGGKPK